MQKTIKIEQKYADAVINIVLDTLKLKKQAIIFVASKASAESQAEKIAAKIKPDIIEKEKYEQISQEILDAIDKPTKQCLRLSNSLKSGVAFHHSGLNSKQREIVEENFKVGVIKFICATPTLAYGLNLPAFRVIVRDLKRFAPPRGMGFIPVLEFQQFCGRAGRPDFNEEYGEAICIADTQSEKEEITDHYINGEPEDILSKLAVEPILRTYVLSLLSSNFCNSVDSLLSFFEKTFYAHQFGNLEKLEEIISKVLTNLAEWEFIEAKDGKLKATLLGTRVSQLYLDPYTANYLIECMTKAPDKKLTSTSFIQMVCGALELRPLLTIKSSEYDEISSKLMQMSEELLSEEPSMFEYEYEDYLKSIKTTLFFKEWINEVDEESLFEIFNVRPGEIKAKLDLAEWLLYSSQELAKLTKMQGLIKEIEKLRLRLKHGAREELIPLLRLQGIGRVRARKLFNNKIHDVEGIKKIDLQNLTTIVGRAIAISLKKQVGEKVDEEDIKVLKTKRKGQMSIEKYG